MPLPSLGGLGTGLGGLANVLGLGLEGYAKDQAIAARRAPSAPEQKDLSDAQMLKVQMDERQREHRVAQGGDQARAEQGTSSNRTRTASSPRDFPDHPDVGDGYVEGGNYRRLAQRGPRRAHRQRRTSTSKTARSTPRSVATSRRTRSCKRSCRAATPRRRRAR